MLKKSTQHKMPEGMVLVPAGEFIMGSTDQWDDFLLGFGTSPLPIEKPQRSVYVDAFYIDIYPVTNQMFAEFVQATGYTAEGRWSGTWLQYAEPGKEKHPVVSVSWNDIMAYCRWTGKRLPTESEWEKASRGTDGRIWPWGNTWDPTKCNAKESGIRTATAVNVAKKRIQAYLAELKAAGKEGGIGTTTPVDSYPKGRSPYGCYDMVGNVWELIADWLSFDYYTWAPTRNPKGPPNGITRVMRGGAFSTLLGNCRCAYRIGPDSSTQFDRVGFRCAHDD